MVGKQFGTNECESLSKLANVVGHQFMSLHEKQKRIMTKNAFKYVKPKEPPEFQRALEFKYQKGKPALEKEGLQVKGEGHIFKTTTREQRIHVMGMKPPEKLTQDTGLGHIDERYYLDNKKKVHSRDHGIPQYFSRVGREDLTITINHELNDLAARQNIYN